MPPKTAHSNPPHVYITVWEDLHKTTQTYTQRKKTTIILAVVLYSFVSTAPSVCVHMDGLNAENTFHCWLHSV